MPAFPLTAFFRDIDKTDVPLVGGKGANLGEMTKAGFPVPNGFAITTEAYRRFLSENNLDKKIYPLLAACDVDNSEELLRLSKSIQKMILSSKIPKEVIREVVLSYKKLQGFLGKNLFAVRSSATAEDMPKASFAGQQATFFNIKGEANLLGSVRDCWASLFTARSIFYRVQNKISHKSVFISVIVQKMIQSEVSGVMFSIDPVTNQKDRIVIESVWGIGELIVQGSVIPDRYVVQKETYSILSKEISDQSIQLIKVGEETKEVEVEKNKRDLQKISDKEIIELAKIADRLQKHYYFPQDIEWAKSNNKLFITQTRPITTLGSVGRRIEEDGNEPALARDGIVPILTGLPASPGIAVGSVRILKSPGEIGKVKNDEILVAPMTSPDYVPAMKKAKAIITDEGGQTSHAAIVSRELGIPCIVGTKIATKKLKDEQIITVDGSRGLIYWGGKIKIESNDRDSFEEINKKTATKLYVNLGEAHLAKEISKRNIDGVGLLRAEFMLANIGVHPKSVIKSKKQASYIRRLTDDLESFCKPFSPRPVVYRATDFKTNEYRQLKGGKSWEPQEPNPMLGFRGAYRYVSDPEVFNLELHAIRQVRKKYKNLWLMIPFVRSPEELKRVRKIVYSEGLFDDSTFKFWMMVELPVNVIMIEDFIKVGIDGVSIGSNDLTMLLTGVDRDNSSVASGFDERSPSVLWSIKRVIKACRKHKVTVSICGQAPSVYDDLVEKLVRLGITSISVNPDAINRVQSVILNTEKGILNG